MTTETKKEKQQTTVYISPDLVARLGRYMLEQRAGKMHVRNQIIVDAIEEFLEREGY